MRYQLVRKRTLQYLAKVSLNGSVFAVKIIRRWIESYSPRIDYLNNKMVG